jgi:GNAT superfamily N-acetyltransferase
VIEVREATIDDADAIATVHIDSWRTGYRGIVADEYLDGEGFDRSRRDQWREWTWHDTNATRLFVVALQGRLIGFGYAGPERLDPDVDHTGLPLRGEVYAFYLHPTAWGSGGAAALMSRCEEYLRDEGFPSAVLWVLRDNPRARGFYEKAGWAFNGRVSDFAPIDSPWDSLPEVQYEVRL